MRYWNPLRSRGAAGWMMSGLLALATAASAAHAASPLQTLLGDVEQRNALADQVALTKWDNHTPVLDASREASELQSVGEQAPSYGLNADDAEAFFSSQIESNKLIQYELLQRWQLAGRAPDAPRPDLTALRAQLDQLQTQLLQALSQNTATRTDPDCNKRIAHTLVRYAHEQHLDMLHYAAMVRSFGDFCHVPE